MQTGRALIVSLGVLLLVVGAYFLRETGGVGWMPPCVFKKVTGLDCPGCGMTRGTTALLNGRVVEAFSYNVVGMILLPVGMLALGVEMLGWVRGKSMSVRVGRWGAFFLAVVVIGWWVGRNAF